MNLKEELLSNKDKIHTTHLGINRIKNNLNINTDNVVEYCVNLIKNKNCLVNKKGKNYYCMINDKIITINSSSFTIITAHSKKKDK